jgi:hypothetical protein
VRVLCAVPRPRARRRGSHREGLIVMSAAVSSRRLWTEAAQPASPDMGRRPGWTSGSKANANGSSPTALLWVTRHWTNAGPGVCWKSGRAQRYLCPRKIVRVRESYTRDLRSSRSVVWAGPPAHRVIACQPKSPRYLCLRPFLSLASSPSLTAETAVSTSSQPAGIRRTPVAPTRSLALRTNRRDGVARFGQSCILPCPARC